MAICIWSSLPAPDRLTQKSPVKSPCTNPHHFYLQVYQMMWWSPDPQNSEWSLNYFHLRKDKICYLVFLVTAIKYFTDNGRYDNAAEETAPIKTDIFSYLHHLYRYMNEISQHLCSPIFLLRSLQVANFPVFLLKWQRRVHHILLTGDLRLWL